jgi:hypothetical protein
LKVTEKTAGKVRLIAGEKAFGEHAEVLETVCLALLEIEQGLAEDACLDARVPRRGANLFIRSEEGTPGEAAVYSEHEVSVGDERMGCNA